uniref:Cytochrome c biogenesis protein CcsA n=1 Tax=Johansenicoccus eremophilus TaxID=3068301 RepID=A0AA49LNB9_9CHLO|nr:heme attachment to plastid cytochrome [Chlorophyceae sp. KF-2023a]
MMYSQFENTLSNAAFLLLFFTMIASWTFAFAPLASPIAKNVNINIAPSQNPASNNIFALANENGNLEDFTKVGFIFSNAALLGLLLVRWVESGHFPLSNLYESLIFLAWSCTFLQIILDVTYYKTIANANAPAPFQSKFWKITSWPIVARITTRVNFSDGAKEVEKAKQQELDKSVWKEIEVPQQLSGQNKETIKGIVTKKSLSYTKIRFLGALISPLSLFIYSFALLCLPKEMQEASPLVPALQSNWLMMHVTVMILSYAALICGSLLSVGYLIVHVTLSPLVQGSESKGQNNPVKFLPEQSSLTFASVQTEAKVSNGPLMQAQTMEHIKINDVWNAPMLQNLNSPSVLELLRSLDNISYRILGLGFPFLTIGILSGAVWANEAWGSYWSWDPKETWALLTWFVFAIYLHTRLTRGWSGTRPAVIASFGFFVVWICFLGVNMLGEGLHSYGWLKPEQI